jgi:hypothetical protein
VTEPFTVRPVKSAMLNSVRGRLVAEFLVWAGFGAQAVTLRYELGGKTEVESGGNGQTDAVSR